MNENKLRIPHEYSVGDSVYIRKSNVEQKLNPLQGPFVIKMVHTNGIVTIRRSPTISKRNQHPSSSPSISSLQLGKRVPYGRILHCIGQRKILVSLSSTRSDTDIPLALFSQDLTQIIYLFLSTDSALG
jgi:hypothetical protein